MPDGHGRPGRVLVLGGTSEIALAVLAELNLQPEAQVLLAGRDATALAAVPLTSGWVRSCLPWDAADPASTTALVEAVRAAGELDVVIAAAGVLGDGSTADPQVAHEVMVVNLVGLVDVLLPVSEQLRAQRRGTIIVLSSVAGSRARRSNFVYGASKAGLDAFTAGLSDRLAGDGVRVLLVRPGFVRGRMTAGLTPAPLSTTPHAVATAVARALRGRAQVVWVPAPLRLVMAVLRLVPRPLWRRLDL